MKQCSGLIYLAVGVVVGVLIGTSLTGLAAAGSGPMTGQSDPVRAPIVRSVDAPAATDGTPGRYTFAYIDGDQRAIFDTHTGTLYRFGWNQSAKAYTGGIMNPVEGWWTYLTLEKRTDPEPEANPDPAAEDE